MAYLVLGSYVPQHLRNPIMNSYTPDLPFLFAILSLGWGLSLATYRMFANRFEWPMGQWHANRPGLPILMGLIGLLFALLFAAARGFDGTAFGGWAVLAGGLLLAVLWTTLLRVASQISLILAPVASVLLVVSWLGGPDALEYRTVRSEVRELRQLLEDSGTIESSRARTEQRRNQPRN